MFYFWSYKRNLLKYPKYKKQKQHLFININFNSYYNGHNIQKNLKSILVRNAFIQAYTGTSDKSDEN